MLQLPSIGETTLENDLTITRTLPRPEKKRSDHQQTQPPPSTDPTRRRGLPEQLNEGYDDNGDDDDAHQNADNMFKLAMDQAVIFERDGIIDKDESYRPPDDSYPAGDDSWPAPPPNSWQPGTDLSSVASYA